MKYLYRFNCEEFNKFIKEDLYLENWFVYDMNAEDRAKMVDYTVKYQHLKKRSEEQEINAKSTEIISWLDTLNIMYYVLDYVDPQIRNELQIFQEMEIPFTHKRADYVLVYRRKILIIEFSFQKLNGRYKFEDKLNQAVGYKELLSNVVPPHIEIGTYTFLIEPETDKSGNPLKKFNKYTNEQSLPNNERIQEFGGYINLFFQKDFEDAMYYLGYVDGYVESMNDGDLERRGEEDDA